ncbi:MAG: DUF1800 domain-containing protein [Acidobacteriota bacterium]|nr:DUF1800 domain-containing protein [Acidobacteriota bacterium]
MKVLHTRSRATALLMIVALLSGTFAPGVVEAQRKLKEQAKAISEEQRILHVLNRLGFGARTGDVERVRAMGVERYVEQQLRPDQIDDAVAASKIKHLPTLSMTTAELLAKYPNPGVLIRQLQRSGQPVPPELAAIIESRTKGIPPTAPNGNSGAAKNTSAMDDAMTAPAVSGAPTAVADGEMSAGPMAADQNKKGASNDQDRGDYRRAIIAYMRENNLESPQRITAELQASRILRAVYSERQLQEVLVDFWTNHFNVFASKGADRWFLTSYDRDTIRPRALGKFRDLLGATAESPAMLFYLDNFQSVSPNARAPFGQQPRRRMMRMNESDPRGGPSNGGGIKRRRQQTENEQTGQMEMLPQQPKRPRRGINENYARELMELHTLGVDGGYTQKDVQEVARAFTGWTLIDPRGVVAGNNAAKSYFNARLHDDGEKTVLGHKIPAGGGIKDGETVLDILSRHPATAKFIATKLCRRFVIDNPSPALIERVAAAFTKSDGDIRETLRAIFTSPEFNSVEARRAKIKTPFELAISAIRTLGGETDGRPALHGWVAKMGEPLYMYQAPTGYPDTAEHWVNTGALLERLNFALALVSNRIPGTRVDLARFAGEIPNNKISQADQGRVVDQFLKLILQGDVSPRTKETLLKQLNSPDAAASIQAPVAQVNESAAMVGNAEGRDTARRGGFGRGEGRRGMRGLDSTLPSMNPEVARIAAMILGTPEFQRQ